MITIRSSGMFMTIAAARQAAAQSGGFTSGRLAEAAAALVTGALAILFGVRSRQSSARQAATGTTDSMPDPTHPMPLFPSPSSPSSALSSPTSPISLTSPTSPADSDSSTCSTLRRLATAVLFGLAAGFLAAGPVSAAVFAAAGFAGGYVLAGRSAAAKAARATQRRLAAAPPAIELFAAGLTAGLLPEQAANTVVDAFGRSGPSPDPDCDPLGRIAESFRIAAAILAETADPALAWAVLRRDPATEPVGTAALRSSRTGAPLAEAVARAARASRLAAHQAAQGQVRSVAVKAVAPLALCFLPAFVLIGIVPTALGLLHQFQR
jgi:Type II secretion system (T2SS), protein F